MEKGEILLGERKVPFAVRVSRQARRISLRISPARNSVMMTLPRRASVASGMKFLHSKAAWILENLENDSHIALVEGAVIPVLGQLYRIKRQNGRGTPIIDHETQEITLFCQPEFIARRLKDFLKKLLQQTSETRLLTMTEKLHKRHSKIVISKASSRWGSCTASGVISLNWLLVFAEPPILDYVIAHEAAHLVEMNHSPRFWKLVEQLHPHAQASRLWLRKEGYRLHRYE